MSEPATCGGGLAAQAPLPSTFGELLTAVAEILEVHMRALDLTDDRSHKEYEAYQWLAIGHRIGGSQLVAIGERMAGYRSLPMGRHDMRAMAAPEVRETFQRFVEREEELLALLQQRLPHDRRMLQDMGGAS